MPLDEDDAAHLWDMLEAARGIVASLTDVTLAQYEGDENLRLAAERRIEIIGEAAGRVSQTVRQAHLRFPGERSLLSAMFWPTSTVRLTMS